MKPRDPQPTLGWSCGLSGLCFSMEEKAAAFPTQGPHCGQAEDPLHCNSRRFKLERMWASRSGMGEAKKASRVATRPRVPRRRMEEGTRLLRFGLRRTRRKARGRRPVLRTWMRARSQLARMWGAFL